MTIARGDIVLQKGSHSGDRLDNRYFRHGVSTEEESIGTDPADAPLLLEDGTYLLLEDDTPILLG